MNVIDITHSECATGALHSDSLEYAIRAIREDGFVVLDGAIDPEHIHEIQTRMMADIPEIAKQDRPPYQFVKGHVQQDPPPFEPYLFRDVVCNDLVIAITHSILGDGLRNTFYSGNTNLPGSVRQPVHVDQGHLWPGMENAHPANMLVVNVPVVDMTTHNGSIELWPGSHLDTTVAWGQSIRVPEPLIGERRVSHPPIQPEVPMGGVLIRDMRLWHRGVPNLSPKPRPMIAMIHVSSWMNAGQIKVPTGGEPYFEHSILETSAVFLDEKPDYLSGHKSYDLRPDEFETGSSN